MSLFRKERQSRVEFSAVAARLQHPRIFSERFLAAVPGNFGKRRVDLDDDCVRVGDQDAFARMGEHIGGEAKLVFGLRKLAVYVYRFEDAPDDGRTPVDELRILMR